MLLVDETVSRLTENLEHDEDLELGKLFLEGHSSLPVVQPRKYIFHNLTKNYLAITGKPYNNNEK